MNSTEPMASLDFNDCATPRPFALPDHDPGVAGDLHTALEAALRQIAADPSCRPW